jgi:HAD superfamily hydrolase (TIGR01509 family)
MAEAVARRFGGEVARWRKIQDASFAWYLEEAAKLDARPGPEREGDAWVDAVAGLNAGQIAWMFARAGRDVPDDLPRLAEELETETVCGINAVYPDVRPAVQQLRSHGFRVYLSTNANRSNGESALVGGGVRDLFDGVVVLEVAMAKKDRPSYWGRAFAFADIDPRDAVVVDDVPRFLEAAATLGARGVQMVRPGSEGVSGGRFPVVRSLAHLRGTID